MMNRVLWNVGSNDPFPLVNIHNSNESDSAIGKLGEIMFKFHLNDPLYLTRC